MPGPLPWASGARPRRLPGGGPGPMSEAHLWSCLLWIRMIFYVCVFVALPDGRARFGARFEGPRGGSKTVLGSSWFSLLFVLRLGIAFCTVLGPACGRFGALLASFWTILGSLGPVLGRLGLSWGRFWTLWMAFWVPIILTSLQLIDVSSLQPTALQHLTTRPGGLREAIKYIHMFRCCS